MKITSPKLTAVAKSSLSCPCTSFPPQSSSSPQTARISLHSHHLPDTHASPWNKNTPKPRSTATPRTSRLYNTPSYKPRHSDSAPPP
mmetsp:Transcript_23257/g.46484  ORF Transcript_23257/g.46484 Transcript_23257/m.46484 type:complete len:87 (-) Transcript_23257:755-1015(-)